MFGTGKINLEISRLWNAVMEADKTARCAVKDGDVISRSNKEAQRKIEEQGEAIMAIARYLGVTFDHEIVPDHSRIPEPAPTIRIMVCRKTNQEVPKP